MQSNICPNCGSGFSYQEGYEPKFCSSCGAQLSFPPPAPAAASFSPAPAKPYTRTELIGALISYLAFYFYIEMFACEAKYCWPVLIVAAFIIGLTAVFNRGRKVPLDSWIWLGCLCLSVICYAFRIGRVWEDYQTGLFMHLFAVWWILSRSGMLLEPDRGDFLPSNALTGFIILPFENFFLRIKTVAGSFRQAGHQRERKKMNWWLIPAALICVFLFYRALLLLGQADTAFENMLSDITKALTIEFGDRFVQTLMRFLLSLPVGCWLFGLISGAQRADRGRLERRKSKVLSFLESIKKLPAVFWEAVIVLFSVLYLAFFILQGSYLFGAFTGKLPEGFIVAEYARQGFFELCRIMAVNALVLWLTTHMCKGRGADDRRFRIFCLVLLLESILFAVIAFSKLALYISIYGFTPLRLQSSWLVCVLFAGCVLWIWQLFSGKRVFRVWMYFSALTLAALMLY